MGQPVTQAPAQSQQPPQPDGAAWAPIVALGGLSLLALAQAHRRRQQLLALMLVRLLRGLWRHVDPARAQQSWAAVSGRAVTAMTVAQTQAAHGAQAYVAAALAHQGLSPDPAGSVWSPSFAGTAADGRPLESLLGYPAFEVSAFVDQGMDPAQAGAIGGRHLERIAATETADAARVATGVAVTNDRRTTGYIRMLTPPSCSRCIILAGKWYEWNKGFARHPQCDCVHVPAPEDVAGDVRTSARDYFDSLSPDEQDQVFGTAGAQAVRDGADLSRVVNARRKGSVYVAGGRKYTTEATTRRGTGRRVRLMPEQIYVEANGNRDEAIRLLRLHGYIR